MILDLDQYYSLEFYRAMQDEFLKIDLEIRERIIESMPERLGLILQLRTGMLKIQIKETAKVSYGAIGNYIGLSNVRVGQLCYKAYKLFFRQYYSFMEKLAEIAVYLMNPANYIHENGHQREALLIDTTPNYTIEILKRLELLESKFQAALENRGKKEKELEKRLLNIGNALHKLSKLGELATLEHGYAIERLKKIASTVQTSIQRIMKLETSMKSQFTLPSSPVTEWSWPQSYNCEGTYSWPKKN